MSNYKLEFNYLKKQQNEKCKINLYSLPNIGYGYFM
jgi:hypothetical protein